VFGIVRNRLAITASRIGKGHHRSHAGSHAEDANDFRENGASHQIQEIGYGHLYQGRFKSFPIQTDAYFQTVIRYVERNPLRANLVARSEDWPWSSLGQESASDPIPLAPWPVPQPSHRHAEQWIDWVNRPQTERELQSLRTCAVRGRPFGDDAWVRRIAANLDLGATLRRPGRPCVEQKAAWAR
jgi:putative transposase